MAGHPGLVAEIGAEALTAGGKRLRPMLTFLSAPAGTRPSVAAGAAVELVHMATLVHDDLIDGARVRRGRAAAWTSYGADAARAAGDYIFARAFSELAARGDVDAVAVLCRGLARARPRGGSPAPAAVRPRHDGRGVSRALCAEDREAVRGGLPARWRQRRLRQAARHLVPDRRRHPRLRGRHDRDRQDPRHRPARRHADPAAHPCRPRRRGRARGACGRAARGGARPGCRDGRARSLPRGRGRLRAAHARASTVRRAGTSSTRSRSPSSTGTVGPRYVSAGRSARRYSTR